MDKSRHWFNISARLLLQSVQSSRHVQNPKPLCFPPKSSPKFHISISSVYLSSLPLSNTCVLPKCLHVRPQPFSHAVPAQVDPVIAIAQRSISTQIHSHLSPSLSFRPPTSNPPFLLIPPSPFPLFPRPHKFPHRLAPPIDAVFIPPTPAHQPDESAIDRVAEADEGARERVALGGNAPLAAEGVDAVVGVPGGEGAAEGHGGWCIVLGNVCVWRW